MSRWCPSKTPTFMRKNLLWLLLAVVFASCTKDPLGDVQPSQNTPPAENTYHTPTTRGAISTAQYHEGAGAWIVAQPDPYTLENFRAAHQKLLSDASKQVLTKAQKSEIAAVPELQATHYAIRIYPKTEAEQWKYELMEGINVSYVPFDQVRLTPEEAETLPAEKSRREAAAKGISASKTGPVFPNSYRYTVTYTDVQTTEGPAPDQTYILPILYAVWPVDRPMPEAEYEVDYEVFLPQAALEAAAKKGTALRSGAGSVVSRGDLTVDFETLTAIEDEAIATALGIPVKQRKVESTEQGDARTRATPSDFPKAYLRHYDTFLKQYVPVANVQAKYTLGAGHYFTSTTRQDGSFSTHYRTGIFFNGDYVSIPDSANIDFIFQHEKWKITAGNTTSAYSFWFFGAFSWLRTYYRYELNLPVDYLPEPVFECARAVNYFYNAPHYIDKVSYPEGIRIEADSSVNNNSKGYFSWVPEGTFLGGDPTAFIHIYNNNRNAHNEMIATILHELGHFSHYGTTGTNTPDGFGSYHCFIQESFASYVGWYLVHEYYYSLNWLPPYINYRLTTGDRRRWRKIDTKSNTEEYSPHYSPLFVDLVDGHNQRSDGIQYPDDTISGVPHWVVQQMAQQCKDWNSLRHQLLLNANFLTGYYSMDQINNYIADYDYWFQHNQNYRP